MWRSGSAHTRACSRGPHSGRQTTSGDSPWTCSNPAASASPSTSRSATATTSAASGCRRSRASTSRTSRRSPAARSARSRAPPPRTSSCALDAAHAAKAAWGKTSPTARANILNKIADRMEQNLELLATAETWDNGKPIRETMAADIPLAIDHFRYFAGCVRGQEGGISEIDDTTYAYHFHEPLGVVGQIIPWNFPILMAVWKLAPALAAGNCVVLKPAEQTPASILVLAELIGDLLPKGVLNIVNGFGLEARQAAGVEQAHRQDRLHRRDDHRPPDHAVREPEPDPGDAGAGRQVAQHLLRRRDEQGRRVLRQGARRLRDVRAEPGRGLHLPVARADPGVDLRPVHRDAPSSAWPPSSRATRWTCPR